MTKSQAHRILDTARAGGLVPAHVITEALGVTGDLSPWKLDDTPADILPSELEAA